LRSVSRSCNPAIARFHARASSPIFVVEVTGTRTDRSPEPTRSAARRISSIGPSSERASSTVSSSERVNAQLGGPALGRRARRRSAQRVRPRVAAVDALAHTGRQTTREKSRSARLAAR
jgi:hypothetical protein